MTIFAVMGVVFLFITFLTTKERIIPKPEQQSSIKEDLTDLAKNRPWLVMLALTILALKGEMYIYYFNDFLNEPALASFLNNIGFNRFIDD